MSLKNTLVRDKREGDNGELSFRRFLESRGCIVEPSDRESNRIDKIDYFVHYNGTTSSFDVKVKDQDHVWLEIQGNYGYPGSIYGKSTHFAIIYRDIDIVGIMETADLRDFVEDNVTKEFTDKFGRDVPYHVWYRRKNRKDITTKTRREFLALSIPSYREHDIGKYRVE